MSLFGDELNHGGSAEPHRDGPSPPLAERMRPATLDDFLGQDQVVGVGRALRKSIEEGNAGSLIVWGPPGTGKTTMALLIARHAELFFEPFSAVLSGVARVRQAIADAQKRREKDSSVRLPSSRHCCRAAVSWRCSHWVTWRCANSCGGR